MNQNTVFFIFGQSHMKKVSQFMMVWGCLSICLSVTGVSKICFLKSSLNATVCQNVWDHFLIPYIVNKFGNNEFISLYNLAWPHTAKSKKEWFQEKKISVLDWPTKKPNIVNPIQNLLRIIKMKLGKYCPSNHEELKWVITKVWALMTPVD